MVLYHVQNISAQSAPLSGTYFIGPGGNYATINIAIDSLKSGGVSGPVVFNIKSGTYNEQVVIPQITGASESNTVTLQSETGDSTQTIITFESGYDNNFIIKLNGADYFIFRNLTIEASGYYGRPVTLDSSSNYNRFESNIIRNQNNTMDCGECGDENTLVYSNYGSQNDYNSFLNNIFENSTYGFFYGNSKGLFISKNIFANQIKASLYLQSQDSISIKNNVINTISDYYNFSALYAYNCFNYFEIEKNKFMFQMHQMVFT